MRGSSGPGAPVGSAKGLSTTFVMPIRRFLCSIVNARAKLAAPPGTANGLASSIAPRPAADQHEVRSAGCSGLVYFPPVSEDLCVRSDLFLFFLLFQRSAPDVKALPASSVTGSRFGRPTWAAMYQRHRVELL